MKQLATLLEISGQDGEMIISKSKKNELIAGTKDGGIVVCPIGKGDTEQADEEDGDQ